MLYLSSFRARFQREHLVRVVARQPLEQRPLGGRRLLQLVDHHLGEALGDPAAHVGSLDQHAVERQEDIAGVEAPRLGQDPVVRGVELGELDLAPRRLVLGFVARFLGLAPGPLGEGGRTDPFGLQPVYPRQQARQEPGRVAADLVPAQRQRVEAVEQDRQPLRPPEHVEEGIEPRRLGVLAQQPLADLVPAADPELLIRALEQRLGVGAQPPRGRPPRADHQRPLRRRPRLRQVGEPPREQLALTGPGGAEDEHRPGDVRGGATPPVRLPRLDQVGLRIAQR